MPASTTAGGNTGVGPASPRSTATTSAEMITVSASAERTPHEPEEPLTDMVEPTQLFPATQPDANLCRSGSTMVHSSSFEDG